MRKNVVYAGLMLIAIAAVGFVFWADLLRGAPSTMLNYTENNFTVKNGGFVYLQIPAGNATTGALAYVFLSGKANVYLFNASTLGAWLNYTNHSYSANGLEYARMLASPNSSAVANNVSFTAFYLAGSQIPPQNSSTVYVAKYNLTAYVVRVGNSAGAEYVVVDNTEGSESHDTIFVTGSVVHWIILSQAQAAAYAAKYHTKAITYLAYAWILVFFSGVAFVIVGLLKKSPTWMELLGGLIKAKLKG